MASTQKKRRNANAPLLWGGLGLYGGLLALFGWQTWMFVNWIFPNDQLLAKVLTLISFDVLALFWSLVHTFFSFKSYGALWWVRIAWGLTFFLSLVASILYLVIQFYFRFHLAVDPTWVSIGNAVSIIALVSNVLALMAWLILEYAARHPHQHEFDDEEEETTQRRPESTMRPMPALVAALPEESDRITGKIVALPAMPDPEKLAALVHMAVRYKQMTEEEARPLLLALEDQSQSQNGKR